MLEDLGPAPAAVKSAARAFRIVEFFDEVRRAARANELAERLGYPQSSTSLLLNSLVRLGYLDFNPATHAYMPSIRTAVLATWRDTGVFSDGSMLAALKGLASRTGIAGCLSARKGVFVRYLHVVQSFGPGDMHITLAARRYAAQSAAGIVLLARLNDREIRDLVHRTRAETDDAVRDLTLAAVIRRVGHAREQGYFRSSGLVAPNIGAIAMALPTAVTGGWQDMSISVAGQRGLIDGQDIELFAAVRDALHTLSPAQPEIAEVDDVG